MDTDVDPDQQSAAALVPAPPTMVGTGTDEVHLIDEYLTNQIQMDVIDRFAESLWLHKQNRRRRRNQHRAGAGGSLDSGSSSTEGDSESDYSENREPAEDDLLADLTAPVTSIQVHLRPTLPRRQLEIPRFSPAAAWRTLANANADDPAAASSGWSEKPAANQFSSYVDAEDDDDLNRDEADAPLESRIERIYRQPADAVEAAAAADTKSGDSGISADTASNNNNQNLAIAIAGTPAGAAAVGPFLAPWTPQQDLGDEEDDDEQDDVDNSAEHAPLSALDYPEQHTFSLSLPRDSNHRAAKNVFMINTNFKYSILNTLVFSDTALRPIRCSTNDGFRHQLVAGPIGSQFT